MAEEPQKTKDVKSVAFSKVFPMDRQLFDYALKQGAFSTYVKRLIQRDMEKGHKVIHEEKNSILVEELLKKNEKLEEEIKSLNAKLEAIGQIINEHN